MCFRPHMRDKIKRIVLAQEVYIHEKNETKSKEILSTFEELNKYICTKLYGADIDPESG